MCPQVPHQFFGIFQHKLPQATIYKRFSNTILSIGHLQRLEVFGPFGDEMGKTHQNGQTSLLFGVPKNLKWPKMSHTT